MAGLPPPDRPVAVIAGDAHHMHKGEEVDLTATDVGLKRVFIPGSPYRAEIAGDGSFSLARLAAGRYEVKAVAADDKIYSALDSLSAGTEYPGSDWTEAEIIWVEKP